MPILKLGDRTTTSLIILTAIGVFVIAARLLIWTDTFHSGLLYIAWPFTLSLMLYYLTSDGEGTSWKVRFWNNTRYSLIVIFSASLILMEGYICVVMSLPIIFLIIFLAFLSTYLHNRSGPGRVNTYLLPFLVLMMSLEGVSEATTFNRYNEVTTSQIIEADVARIRERLTHPVVLQSDRRWILALFPLPHRVSTLALEPGEMRRYQFAYHRWFVTNTHSGTISVRLEEVDSRHIKTTIEDSSYLSNYLRLHGSEFRFQPLSKTQTRVSLTIKFDRLLDPLWFFEPLQRFAVKKGAAFFLDQVLGGQNRTREPQTKAEDV